MGNKIKRLLPPGYPVHPEKIFFLLGILCSFLFSLNGWFAYGACYGDLWKYSMDGKRTSVLSGARMPEFSVLFQGVFAGFEIFAVLALVWSILHYRYFYQGSKSIYLMKRLPDGEKLYRDCLALPIIMAAVYLLGAAILVLVYFGIYLLVTPEACMIPENFAGIWRVLL